VSETADRPVLLAGMPGSPYSRKMRALLRYRRIPYRWVMYRSPEHAALPPAPLPLIPALYLPEGAEDWEALSDSTFQIQRLEAAFPRRSAVPQDPALAFLDGLLEDYADEWVTKMMYHYRWAVRENAENANKLLPRWNLAVPEELAQAFPEHFGKRQVERLALVGSNPTTGPLIEADYRDLLEVLERHLRSHPFVMGRRPGRADFALHGQLSQLVQVEPTSQALARAVAPRVVAWCDVMEDLSGLSVEAEDWHPRDALPETVGELLALAGAGYAPFLRANARALAAGAPQVDCRVRGERWTQPPFRYQGKCLQWLREAHAALAPADRDAVDAALAGSGCEALFAADG
jgi:glutathione S-transferase